MKWGCHRRCWKCPPWASIHNWTRRCMFLNVAARTSDVTAWISRRVTYQVCVVCSCRHALLDDTTERRQVGSNLVTFEAIVLVKLLCQEKMIGLQPCSRQKCGLWPHLVGDNRVWVPDHVTDSQIPGLLTVVSKKTGPIIRRYDNAQNMPTFWEWRGSSTSACGFSLPHKRLFWEFT
jgi:hypothetical protein